jgi:hypothetical protein
MNGTRNSICGFEVPRQCSLVLWIEVMHVTEINLYMMLEGLYCSEI